MIKIIKNSALCLAIVALPSLAALSQNAHVLWQKNIGGIGYDWVNAITTDAEDNSYVLSTVQEGDNHQVQVSKLNSDGMVLWTNTIGGDRDDTGADIIVDHNGNIVIVGASYSKNLAPSVKNKGFCDVFVAKINSTGQLLEIASYGGSQIDQPASLVEKSNGNLLITATSWSEDNDVPNNEGGSDIWFFELASNGSIVWSKTEGGSNDEYAVKTILLENDAFITLANTETYSGSYSANHGDQDIVLYHMDAVGELNWMQLYGGFQSDLASGVAVLENGNYLVAGTTFSNDGNVDYNAGGSDAWIFEVSEGGFLQSSATYGSYGNESIAALLPKNDGFVVFGTSNSTTLNDAQNHGNQDFWLYEINAEKEITDEYLFGASGYDAGYAAALASNGSVLMGGISNSSDGLVQVNNGQRDGLLLKINKLGSGSTDQATLHPNPTDGVIYINQLMSGSKISVVDMNGIQVQMEVEVTGSSKFLDLTNLPSGVYLVRIDHSEGTEIHRIVKR